MLAFFDTLHWDAILKIVGIDIMLGVDNAIVIALACSQLPENIRNRAMLLGTAAAVVLRGVLLWAADHMMDIPYLKLVAGAYLLYIGYTLLVGNESHHDIKPADRVFTAIKTIIVADFMMSLDNVLGVASAAHGTGEHSTLYAISGIVLSIPIIIYGAKYLSNIMAKYPVVTWLGAGLLGWVGAEMMISDPFSLTYMEHVTAVVGQYDHLLHKFAGSVLVLLAAATTLKLRKPV